MGLIKFFGLEKEGEVIEKVYCEECKATILNNKCDILCSKNPKRELEHGTWYDRPKLEDHLQQCRLKNKNNDCLDFEKK